MPAPPSYKTASSQENLAAVNRDLTADDKKDILADDDLDTASSFTDATISIRNTAEFNATKTLNIAAHGIRAIRLPFPSSELQISVHNSDGTLAYVSTREKRSSGDAVLSTPGRGDLVSSHYKWGPGRPPTLRLLTRPDGQGEVTTSGKWTSRAQVFSCPATTAVKFEWRYRRERVLDKDQQEHKRTLLVLEVSGDNGKTPTRIAQLLRDDETRTPGTKSCTAGNGGSLMLDTFRAEEVDIPEELVVSSCIMMLKKEVDRRRAQQMIVIAGVAGS